MKTRKASAGISDTRLDWTEHVQWFIASHHRDQIKQLGAATTKQRDSAHRHQRQ